MRLRWGILGTGKIVSALVWAIPESGRGEVVAIASADAARARRAAEVHGIGRAHASYEALVADPDVDAVYVALPNDLHAPWTIRALEAGKHVLCEKPFALTAAEVDRVFAAARRAGRVAADGLMVRHHPRIRRLRALVEEGAIGEAFHLRASFTIPLGREAWNPRFDPARGGGCLRDLGIYPIGLARYLFGRAPARVAGAARRGPTGVDLGFTGLLDFGGGRTAAFDCAFDAPYRTEAEVVGTDGTLRLLLPWRPDEAGSALLLRRGDREEEVPVEGNRNKFLLEVEEIHRRILDGAPAEIPEAETRDDVETIERLLAAG